MVAWRKKEDGNVGELLGAGLCILAMLTVMMSCFSNIALLQKKVSMGQIARKYILRMEVAGYLEAQKEQEIKKELSDLGVTELSLEGTTIAPVHYGDSITLNISGKLEGKYDVRETKTSTAKN